MTCPRGDQPAAFHSHRPHPPTSLVGPVRYQRASYLCRRCGKGLFPLDHQAGLTPRNLTPALERIAALAGTVADRFAKGADRMQEMAGVRWGESTVERTTADAGARRAQQLQAGRALGPRVVWPWHKDYRGRRCAYVELDATGVRQQGEGGKSAEGRRACVGLIGNPLPEWPWPDEKQRSSPARYRAGWYPLAAVGPLRRRQAAQGGMGEADCWIGLTDGGNGREDRLEENFPLLEVVKYLAEGWQIGSGAVESACKTVVGQRLQLAGMRWGEDGADAVCHLRALYRSEKGQWEAFWNRDYTN